MKDLQTLVIEAIESMDSSDLMSLSNTYCDAHSYDDHIYNNDDDFLNERFSDVVSAVRAISYGDYHYNHKYAQINGQANLDSYDEVTTDMLVDRVEVIAAYAIDNRRDFDMFDWSELESEAEEEEEED